MVHFRYFLTVFPLMTAALFCYFFTFLLKKGVQKRVPQNRLIIRKTHFMGGTLKNRGHILWFFTRDSWVCKGVRCPSQKSLFFRTYERTYERTDIGSVKLPDVIGASRNNYLRRLVFLERMIHLPETKPHNGQKSGVLPGVLQDLVTGLSLNSNLPRVLVGRKHRPSPYLVVKSSKTWVWE